MQGSNSRQNASRVYPLQVAALLRAASRVALLVYGALLLLLFFRPEVGLRLLWSALIPLAPTLFLLFPNVWVSVCPLATIQSSARKFGDARAVRLSAKASRMLHLIGWVLLLVGAPSRLLLFNADALATLIAALAVPALVIVCGLRYLTLSGWCMGLCPIRPAEALYGQMAVDLHRPLVCARCTGCVPACHRAQPESGSQEFIQDGTQDLVFGFPGFVAAYFLLDLLWLPTASAGFAAGIVVRTLFVYGVCAAGFAVSLLLFRFIASRSPAQRQALAAAAILAYVIYYSGTVPKLLLVWNWPSSAGFILAVIPAVALAVALRSRRLRCAG